MIFPLFSPLNSLTLSLFIPPSFPSTLTASLPSPRFLSTSTSLSSHHPHSSPSSSTLILPLPLLSPSPKASPSLPSRHFPSSLSSFLPPTLPTTTKTPPQPFFLSSLSLPLPHPHTLPRPSSYRLPFPPDYRKKIQVNNRPSLFSPANTSPPAPLRRRETDSKGARAEGCRGEARRRERIRLECQGVKLLNTKQRYVIRAS